MERSVAHQTVRVSSPERVESDLLALRREVARSTPAPRALMSNLVIFEERSAAEPADVANQLRAASVVDVATRHPSRIILLAHSRLDERRAPLAAAVGVVVVESAASRYAVEQIAVRSTCAEESLPSIVRRLTRGDMPTSVWWTEDLSASPPLRALLGVGRQFIYDSHEWHDVRQGFATAAAILDQARVPDLVDLNWRRLAPLRRALVHGVRTATDPIAWPLRVRVLHRPGYEASAWLMFGWLYSKLGHDVEPDDRDVVAEAPAGDALLHVVLALGEAREIAALMTDGLVTVTTNWSASACSQPIRPEAPADAIAAELRSLRRDPALAECLRTVHRSFSSIT